MDNPVITDTTKRHATVAELAHQMQDRQPVLGGTAMQKLIYILQVWKKVPAGYSYRMYHFGPYSGLLLADIKTLAKQGVFEVRQVHDGQCIIPAEKLDVLRESAADHLGAVRGQIAEVVEAFGDYNARDLELRATAVFIAEQMRESGELVTPESITVRLKQAKPKFHEKEMQHAIVQLGRLGVIALAN